MNQIERYQFDNDIDELGFMFDTLTHLVEDRQKQSRKTIDISCGGDSKGINYIKIQRFYVEYKVLNTFVHYFESHNFPKIVRQRCGGISISRANNYGCGWDVNFHNNLGAELTCTLGEEFGGYYRLVCGPAAKEHVIGGRLAFNKFKAELEKRNITPTHLVTKEEGIKLKATIEPADIRVLGEGLCGEKIVLDNVHHLDINSSYPAGLAECWPEVRPIMEEWYEKRHEEGSHLKEYMVSLIGVMQANAITNKNTGNTYIPETTRYCWYAKQALHSNYMKIQHMLKYIEEQGRFPILTNTDGIWYQGDLIPGLDSKVLGEWKTDYKNCTLRIKSRGCYEFIDGDGNYHPVVRGYTTLDSIEPDRSKWHWGDIFRNDIKIKKYAHIGNYIIEKENEIEYGW